MLVITRRPSDRILFPKLGITVHVVRVDGRNVRLGIEAPKDVHILRHELADNSRDVQGPRLPQPTRANRNLRNRLQAALLSLHLIQRRLEMEELPADEAESEVAEVLRTLTTLETGFAPERVGSAGASAAGRRSALLVEDNAIDRALVAGILENFNYEVATANDGHEALEYLATHRRPDVVLLEVNMPMFDGPAMVREIRSNPELRGVKLIAVTAQDPRQATLRVGPDGVDRWFTKPIVPSVLVRELHRELASAATV
jgi:carbon storage regulator CsrA